MTGFFTVEASLKRSLGSRVSFFGLPPLPTIHIKDLECGVSDIRNHVILGFLPGFPNVLVTIRNPRRTEDTQTHGFQGGTMIATACLLAIDPGGCRIVSDWRYWSMPAAYYQNLGKTFTAVIGPRKRLLQVSCFCLDREEGSGTIVFRDSDLFESQSRRSESADWSACATTCSTTEVGMADVCFSRAEKYIPVLLRTRCIFFLRHSVNPVITHPHPANPCWTDESGDTTESPGGVLVFELDIFVERLLARQGHVFGHGDASGWQYYAMVDPRPPSIRESVVHAAAQRGHHLSIDLGFVLILGVLGDDARSILLLTLFLDPLALGTADHVKRKDFLVLDAKRWHLAEATMEDATQILRRAIEQIHKVERTALHDCQRTCHHSRGGGDGITVLATYEADGARSLTQIEGPYWTISGTEWDDKVR